MKEQIANWLIRLAEKICPTIKPEATVWGIPTKLGLTIHIDKKDIRKYRREHSEIHSFRAAKRAIIDDTKKKIGMSISGTLAKRRLVHYDVDAKAQSATVSGYIGVYVSKMERKKLGFGKEDR